MKHGSRGNGKSAGAHARYIQREDRYSYNLHEVRYIESGNLPSWSPTGIYFWDMADTHAIANARLYTELEVALPRELAFKEQVKLTKEFIASELGNRHPYTVAIHESPAQDGGTNPHFHLMFSTRTMDGVERSEELFFKMARSKAPEKGGAPKDRSWIARDRLVRLRASWEIHANNALERVGVGVSIDRRTLKEQGIDRSPEPKITPFEAMLWRQGVITPKVQEVLLLRDIAKLQGHEKALCDQAKVLESLEKLVDTRDRAKLLLTEQREYLRELEWDRERADRTVAHNTERLHETSKTHREAVEAVRERFSGAVLAEYRENLENASDEVSELRRHILNYGKDPGRLISEPSEVLEVFSRWFGAEKNFVESKLDYRQLQSEIASPALVAQIETQAKKELEDRGKVEAERNDALEAALSLRERIGRWEDMITDLEGMIGEVEADIEQEASKLSPAFRLLLESDENRIAVGQDVKPDKSKAQSQGQGLELKHSMEFDFSDVT